MFKDLIRKGAINSWLKEANTFVDQFTRQPLEKRADYFIYGTRTRAGLQIEGHLTLPDGTAHRGPELLAYPLMISWFDKIIDTFNKQGAYTEAGCVSIWRFTLLSYLYPELEPVVNRLWLSIIETKPLWSDTIRHHYQLDSDEGMDQSTLKPTYELLIEILKITPPQKTE